MRVLGLIPARGGSKGVPRKNIRLLAGKPLLFYTAKSALSSRRLDKILLSTEDAEIANVGRGIGLEVPFMRPVELAQDSTPTIYVVKHALEVLAAGGNYYDAVCLLQPTSPFRPDGMIDACIDLLETSKADSVVSVQPVPAEYNPHWVYFQTPDNFLQLSTGEAVPIPRRQELPPAFHRDGSVYLTRASVILKHNNLYGSKVAGYLSTNPIRINIDTMADWDEAERFLEQHPDVWN